MRIFLQNVRKSKFSIAFYKKVEYVIENKMSVYLTGISTLVSKNEEVPW